jgi:hypothetical protein
LKKKKGKIKMPSRANVFGGVAPPCVELSRHTIKIIYN